MRNCPDVTIQNSLFGICLFEFVVFSAFVILFFVMLFFVMFFLSYCLFDFLSFCLFLCFFLSFLSFFLFVFLSLCLDIMPIKYLKGLKSQKSYFVSKSGSQSPSHSVAKVRYRAARAAKICLGESQRFVEKQSVDDQPTVFQQIISKNLFLRRELAWP